MDGERIIGQLIQIDSPLELIRPSSICMGAPRDITIVWRPSAPGGLPVVSTAPSPQESSFKGKANFAMNGYYIYDLDQYEKNLSYEW